MKSALVAVDPMTLKKSSFANLCEAVDFLQEKRILSGATVVSVMHPAQQMLPYSFYLEQEEEFARQIHRRVCEASKGKFSFANNYVFRAKSDHTEEKVSLVSRFGRRSKLDLLIVSSSCKKGVPYWLLGSFSETASLTARMPILVIKSRLSKIALSRKLNIVIGIDVAAPPSASDLSYLASMARSAHARLHLLYVKPKERLFFDDLQERKSVDKAIPVLKRLRSVLEGRGITTTTSIKEEGRSIAHALTSFAEEKGALLTVVTTPKRSKARTLLLGSTARATLALTKRPLLSLRT